MFSIYRSTLPLEDLGRGSFPVGGEVPRNFMLRCSFEFKILFRDALSCSKNGRLGEKFRCTLFNS